MLNMKHIIRKNGKYILMNNIDYILISNIKKFSLRIIYFLLFVICFYFVH